MPPRKRTTSKEVDETVKNQESPGISTEDRSPEVKEDSVPKMAPAQQVDETVRNQESLGSGNVVDRNPGPQLVEDSKTGGIYDVSKSSPELVDPNAGETEARRNRIRQTESVLDAKNVHPDENEKSEVPKIRIEFLESGLTAAGKVHKKGEILEIEDTEQGRARHKDTNGDFWFDRSADGQQERYGKVIFEKR